MIALTSEQLSERRAELATVEEQIRALGRRRTLLRQEILTGYALPSPGGGKQLPLPAVEEPAPEPKVLGPLTIAQVRQLLLDEINTWKRWHSGAAADHALWRELHKTGHACNEDGFDLARQVDNIGHEALTALAREGKVQCDGSPGNWGNGYAPLSVPRTAEGGPDEPKPPRTKTAKKPSKKPAKTSKPAPKAVKTKAAKPKAKPEKPPMALGDVIDGVLRKWGSWLGEEHLEAEVREAMPLNAGPSVRDWRGVLKDMLAQKRIERREEEGRVQYRIRPLSEEKPIDWRRERQQAVAHIADQHKANLPIGRGDPPGTPLAEVLAYFEAASALSRGTRGWDYELSCHIDEKRISEGVWRMSLDYLLDTVDDSAALNGEIGPTVKELAELLEVPLGLAEDLVSELGTLSRIRKDPREMGEPTLKTLRAPKGKKKRAQDRTDSLFPGVEPAPARDGEEAAE